MKTYYSNPRYAQRMLELHEQRMRLNPPAIPFTSRKVKSILKKKKKKEDSSDDEDDGKSKTKSLDLRMDPSDEDSPTHTYKVVLFREGSPEDWLKFLIEFKETIVAGYPLTTYDQQILVFRTLLDGPARDRFDAALRAMPMVPQQNGVAVPATAEVQFNAGVNAISAYRFTPYGGLRNALRRQRNYMRYDLYFEAKEGAVDEFKLRLQELNKYCLYFPSEPNARRQFDEDELVEIIDRVKPAKYGIECLRSRYIPFDHSLDEFCDYL